MKIISCLDIVPVFKPGDPPPTGYTAWHDWAGVQHKAGLRQKSCVRCGRWKFPQELQDGSCCKKEEAK